jgi:hypothetical protein
MVYVTGQSMKEFTLDGARMTSVDALYDEVQRVLCPGFSGFGRNWDAFRDVLRGGFGAYELNENIGIRIISKKKAKKTLPKSQWRKLIRFIEEAENVTLLD